MICLFVVVHLLRLSTIASDPFRKAPGCLKFQRTRNIRTIRGYRRYLILRVARLSMTAMNGGKKAQYLVD